MECKPPTQLTTQTTETQTITNIELPQLQDWTTSNTLQIQTDPSYKIHGNSSFISLPTSTNAQSTVSITHISQQSANESSDDDDSSDSVQEEQMKNVSSKALKKIETDYDIDLRKSTMTMMVIHEDDVKLTEIKPSTSKCTSIDTEQSDSDDYHIRYNNDDDDAALNERCAVIRKDLNDNYIKYKWRKLIQNRLFYARIPTGILTILLMFVSVAYCIGQMCRTELDLITRCQTLRKREEIWEHSGNIQIASGSDSITTETQYGWTDEACWTTHRTDIDTKALWYSNKYKYQWVKNPLNGKTVLFGLVSLYCLCIILYIIIETIKDIIDAKHNILHKKSSLYRYQHRNTNKGKGESIWLNYFRKMTTLFQSDTSAWIIMMFMNELIEIILQTQALLLYNGYYLFDINNERDIYLANKPDFIVIFAAILAFNCFSSGLCWLFYVLCSRKCHGLIFRLTLFYTDQISDLLYTLFPFIIVLADDYTQKADNVLILLAQLNIDSGLAFVAAFVPLLILCNKCLFISINLVHKMRDEYYNQWQFIQSMLSQTNNKLIQYQAQLRGLKTQKSFIIGLNQKEIFDSKGNIQINLKTKTQRSNKVSWINNDSKRFMKPICLMIMSLLYVILGIMILLYTTTYINETEQYCNQINESKYFYSNGSYKYNTTLSKQEIDLFTRNPELFLYDKCLYPVFPFVNDNRYKCQCRVFVIDWRSAYTDLLSNVDDRLKYFNITQSRLLSRMMQNWYMLEKLSTQGTDSGITASIEFNANMFKGRKMRAFSWISARITGIDEATSVKSWALLEYFHIENTNNIQRLPSDFDQLRSLKYFRSTFGGLTEFPQQLCSLTQLKVIQIEWDSITSIPHCILRLTHLQQVLINGCITLSKFPIALFALPELIEVSLWKSPEMTFKKVLAFNNITNTSTDSLERYFDVNFKWNHDTVYYLSLTSLCEERNELPTNFQAFLNKSMACIYICDATSASLCPPNAIGDGRCDFGCNENGCLWDKGDCNHLCFFSPLSECTWELFENDVCDEECNNRYCQYSSFGTTSFDQITHGADSFHCNLDENSTTALEAEWNAVCHPSRYENIYTNQECLLSWPSDGFCDDACRTDACLNDNGDCDGGCIDDGCSLLFNVWTSITGTNQKYLLTKEELCNFLPMAIEFFDLSEDGNCTEIVVDADINQDMFINFREFVIISLRLWDGIDWSWYNVQKQKVLQVNCSQCIGMEHYNDIHQD